MQKAIVMSVLSAKEASAHVRSLLYQKLKEAGDASTFLTYVELDELVQANVRKNYSSQLQTVRRNIMADYGLVFKTISNQGLKPLSAKDKIEQSGPAARKRIQSCTESWRKNQESIKPSELTTQAMIAEYTAETLRLNLQEDLNNARQQLAIEAAVERVTEGNKLDWRSLKQTLHQANAVMRNVG